MSLDRDRGTRWWTLIDGLKVQVWSGPIGDKRKSRLVARCLKEGDANHIVALHNERITQ